jgi:transposase
MTVLADATTETLLSVIRTLNAALQAEQKAAAESRREIARLVAMVEGLTKQLDLLLRDRDEERRAELARLRQEALALAEAAKAAGSGGTNTEPSTESDAEPNTGDSGGEAAGKQGKRDNHGRTPIPQDLPRDVEKLKPECCERCGSDKLLVSDVLTSEEYDYVRAHVRVRRLERTTCVCAECNARIVPEQPPMPFDRAACTFAMMAWLCFAKGGLFLPLDRIRRDFEDQGVPLASSTLTRWWQRGADLLMPVAAAVRLSLLADTHIRTDGTGLRVVLSRVKGEPTKGPSRPGETDEAGWLLRRGPTNGQILVFGNDEHAVYHFTETKEGHHAMDFLTLGEDADGKPIRWRGTLTADALNAHDCLYEDGDRIESGCNGHGLRKFRDDADKAPLLASRAMGFIGGFYEVEAEAKAKKMHGAELLAHRQARAGPIAERFRAWLDEHVDGLFDTNPVRKAMRYYINHWDALTRFLTDPDVPLDNNWSERALRKVALLRNNSLYAGGIDGAVRLCTLLTLINTCRLLGVDPFDYLVWALTRVVPHRSNRGVAAIDLTPAAYKTAQ